MMISNLKKPLVFMVYTNNFQCCKGKDNFALLETGLHKCESNHRHNITVNISVLMVNPLLANHNNSCISIGLNSRLNTVLGNEMRFVLCQTGGAELSQGDGMESEPLQRLHSHMSSRRSAS